jgi:hypothetical protein
MISDPRKVSPLLKNILSPGFNEAKTELNFEMVCHGVLVEVPELASLPLFEK